MAQIQDLPVEILSRTFKHIYVACKEESKHSEDSECSSGSDTSETLEITHSPSKFPFNVARTCKLWCDIVLDSPENWETVQFDLSQEPGPLLRAFAASQTLLFSLVVFTTADNLTDEGKALEKERVSSIALHLQPHANRCTSIDFESAFASSLPSPVPILSQWDLSELEGLWLNYKKNDLPLSVKEIDVSMEGQSQVDANLMPKITWDKLSDVSMGISAFMELIHLGVDWLGKRDPESYSLHMNLFLSDFQFSDLGTNTNDKEYTVTNFINLAFHFNPRGALHLHDISTTNDLQVLGATDLVQPGWHAVHFVNDSPKLVDAFFRITKFKETQFVGQMYFEQCVLSPFPCILPCSGTSLVLRDMPAACLPADRSLYNVFSAWEDGILFLYSCPGFDDDFIDWLVQKKDGSDCHGAGIFTLNIYDCIHFTSGAIRRLVTALNDPARLDRLVQEGENNVQRVAVCGRGPQLASEDLEWFENCYDGEANVTWRVKNEDGYEIDKQFKGNRRQRVFRPFSDSD